MHDFSLRFTNLALGYEGLPAIQNITGTIQKGTLTAIIGPNGSGKSTLLKGIAGILAPLSGSCTIDPNARIAYLPQIAELDRTFPATVADLVSLGLWPERGLLRSHREEDRKRLNDALVSVGLAGFEKRPLSALSGGQLQRALFARVILQQADIILLDEPFNAIDASTINDLLTLIKAWHAAKRTVLAVMHDLSLVRNHFTQAIFVNGELIACGSTEQVLNHRALLLMQGMDTAGTLPVQHETVHQ
ncbi:ABC transporter [Superficieibacter electus]|uniref:ABC transporter n=1 Tax=Superficieibacter electus TaxID=2022662 RepID=A0A2P5GVP8_9ENTR|nr:zinc ABC transporter ATP-binding protein AztA [Superficieibacter electus]POP47609.1 ABC transporter [Superficieibacter electus]POP50620.1 ABC transporter [Superficieibacter electus]